MIPIKIILDGEGCWPDLAISNYVEAKEGWEVALLDKGMSSGKPSVAIRLKLPDGSTVIAQTSARLFCSAANAFMAKHPHLFLDTH